MHGLAHVIVNAPFFFKKNFHVVGLTFVLGMTQAFLDNRVRHVHKVVLGPKHSLLFMILDCPIFFSSLHFVYRDGVLCIHLENKAFLALCLKFLIHNFYLEIVCFSTCLKITWNLSDLWCCAHLPYSQSLDILWLHWYNPRLLPLAAWWHNDSTSYWTESLRNGDATKTNP